MASPTLFEKLGLIFSTAHFDPSLEAGPHLSSLWGKEGTPGRLLDVYPRSTTPLLFLGGDLHAVCQVVQIGDACHKGSCGTMERRICPTRDA